MLAEGGDRGETTQVVKQRVRQARELMLSRNHKSNALLGSREIEKYCPLRREDAEFLETALHRLGLSIRAYHRIIKVARTIADLDGNEQIEKKTSIRSAWLSSDGSIVETTHGTSCLASRKKPA